MPPKKTKIKKNTKKSGVPKTAAKKGAVVTRKKSVAAPRAGRVKANSDKKTKAKKNTDIFLPPRGMHDILPADAPPRDKVVEVSRRIAEFYDFSEINTPVLEKADLFKKGIGEKTDIVEKEMYTLRTKGGDKLALRPEGTAPVIRAYLQHGMRKLPQPQKLYYFGPFFRHERPQAGRYRQFWQVGLEIVGGESDPVYDAQIMVMFYNILDELKTGSLMININSIGCRTCRPGYKTKLANYYKGKETCRDCQNRIKDNTLRLLDCKKESCQPFKAEAPSILDSLCSPCRNYLRQVLEYLEELELPYLLNPALVRGLDYYSRTVFEIFAEGDDFALVAGGRYDYLVEMLGGRPTPAGGAAMGVGRVTELMKEKNPKLFKPKTKKKVFLVHIGELAKKKSLPLMEEFRKANIPIRTTFGKNSLSSQLETANKSDSDFALILGQKEVYEESIIIRNMETGVQETVPFVKVVDEVRKKTH